MRTWIAATAFLLAASAGAQDWVVGVEANDAASYSFITHYSRQRLDQRRQLVYWQTGSYLTYRIRENGEETRINSPGVSTGGMLRWEERGLSAGIGAGWEFRWTERRPPGAIATTTTEQGPVVLGDVGNRIAQHTSIRGAASYSAANRWRAASADLCQDVGRFRVGPQVIWQGNEDIKVTSAGALLEIPMGTSALQLRGGRARIENRDGTSETKPYFSAGIVASF